MAKRRRSKSAAVRDYLAKDPDASPQDVAKALNVKLALVYNVKSSMKAKEAGVKRKKPQRRVSVTRVDASSSGQNLLQAARLIKTSGGFDEARAALKTAEQIVAALEK